MKIITFLFILLLSFSVFGQKSNEWKGVILDATKADEIIAKFGKPKNDKKEKIFVADGNKLFDENLKKGQYRVISYKEIEQAKDVRFGFNSQNVIVFIEFRPIEKLNVQSFLNAYSNINFQPISVSLLGMQDNMFYNLFSETENSYLLASVNRGIFGSATKNTEINKQTQSNKTLQGNIFYVQFISKTLENTKGQDVLK